MQKVYLFGIALLLAFASVYFASAGGPNDAIIRTIPAQSIWIADGVTEYRMDIYADTTQLPNENASFVRSIDWRLMKPQGLQNNIIITQTQAPIQNDFFIYGATPFGFGSNWSPQSRVANPGGEVPINQGYVASYWFKVMPGVNKISTNFVLNNVRFRNATSTSNLPYHVENVPFTVIPRQATYTNAVVCDDLSC